MAEDSAASLLESATTAYQKGDAGGALALSEKVLSDSPNDLHALFQSALYNFTLNNLDVARGRLERLVALSGSYFVAWELMVQVTQAQGDLVRRDEAIEQVKAAISSAIDPAIRRRGEFIRDRIQIGDETLLVADFFSRAGPNFTRYQATTVDTGATPTTGFLLRTDEATTENWNQTALLPSNEPLFHLDFMTRQPDGTDKVSIYEFYVGEPDYDRVRATLMKILRGELQPLSGPPATLQGVLKH